MSEITNSSNIVDAKPKPPKWFLDIQEKGRNISEIVKIINEVIPDWCVKILDEYSVDYPHLKDNWIHCCKRVETTPNKIVVVRDIPTERDAPHFRHIHTMCDYLTRLGCVVRRVDEIIECSVCGRALASKALYDAICNLDTDNVQRLRQIKMVLPEVWSEKCREC